MMDIIDENLEIEEKETWKVTDDLKADWCLDKIREVEAEYNRFSMVAKAKIEQIQAKLQSEKEREDRETSFFESKLLEYFQTVKTKDTKTQKKYSLPSGTLRLKLKGPEYKRDNVKLVEWLENNKLDEFVKVKKSADWAALKKNIAIVGNRVVSKHTGEVIEGVQAVERPAEFKVEV